MIPLAHSPFLPQSPLAAISVPVAHILDPTSALLQEYALATRSDPLDPQFRQGRWAAVRTALDDDGWLQFVDFLLHQMAGHPWWASQRVDELRTLLTRAGSALTVGERDGHPALVTRVPAGVADAVRGAIAAHESAGALLSEAWHAAFGRDPDPEEAHAKAIKAVEEAGVAVVSPKNKIATLGTMLRDMEAQQDWVLPLSSVAANVPIEMAKALWEGQDSRHGGNNYRKPTAAEAEAAVMLAVPLVQWFASGVLARRPSPGVDPET